jgi:hypothetical protein
MKKIALALGVAALLALPAGIAMTSAASAATVERNTVTSTFLASANWTIAVRESQERSKELRLLAISSSRHPRGTI